ncbi:hypothetical protein [Aliivibrio kagoshimensis]|uniref:hypothetical protein n=1 Tax=Aliivibrio kagoshimensis TaxID=2910230 RepID=UPI003D0D7821
MMNLISTHTVRWLLLLSISFLFGCAEHVAERSGSDVDLYPITYTLNLKINPKHVSRAEEELTEYLEQHWDLVTTQPMSMVWRSDLGEALINKTVKQLRKQGLDTKSIQINEELVELDQRFDFQLTITQYRVLVDRCEYTKIGHYSRTDEGCFSNGARWQSMVNPERALQLPVGEK